ncbi:MAG: HD domain-containing protein [Anaerolineae bacterium]|nr:HD domain-containing protein [Anaerolineae bacterium]
MIEYYDRIYGPAEIDEPVLVDVLHTRALQRLRDVLQHGISGLLGVTRPTSRFEHSVGVMLLVRRMGASVTEQLAALLHDVSHTAFSHVIDYVYGGYDSQCYHEVMKETYIAHSDLPEVLARYGYNWREFLDEHRFSLLERPAPALCADRLDYFFRDSFDLGLASWDDIQQALKSLVVYQNQIVVTDLVVARWIADTYMAADHASWASFREVGLYELCAQAIRYGLETGVIGQEDLWSTDAQVWQKLQACPDERLRVLLQLISPQTRFVWDEDHPSFCVSTKLRTVDPHVLWNGRLHLLSEVDPTYAARRAAYLRSKQGRWPMRVIPPQETVDRGVD